VNRAIGGYGGSVAASKVNDDALIGAAGVLYAAMELSMGCMITLPTIRNTEE